MELSPQYQALISWSNLLSAAHKAARGKRGRMSAAAFEHQLADKLIQLQDELRSKSYLPGAYRSFMIHDPKSRKISAAPFKDRVVHHALCNIIEPQFERRFIRDSYANRIGKGTHAALDRLQYFARRYPYVLRLDIVKHFPSLDHEILKRILFKVVKDADSRWLIRQIIASGVGVLTDEYRMVYFKGDGASAINRARGLPIGNLTSQFWSNCYLDPLDHFIKRELRCAAYLRYVDDAALFAADKAQLYEWKQAVIERLTGYRLTIHESQAQVTPTANGIPWLGFVSYPTHRKVKRRKVVAFTRRFRRNIAAYQAGELAFDKLSASVQGWVAHVAHADSYGLRRYLFNQYPIRFGGTNAQSVSK